MGLQSAMTTALTGLQAAEATIDVVGNNVANSNTVGFKESNVLFATQFLQTQSIGSAPSTSSGGTNPRQIGLGVRVAEISPNFTQGTIEVSANPLDLAIQGDGFFIVAGPNGGGQQLYTRNGQFKTNSENELVSLTGDRLLGYGVNDSFIINTNQVVPLTIPYGGSAVAQETNNVNLVGNLLPNSELISTQPGVIESVVLTNNAIEEPANLGPGDVQQVAPTSIPSTATVTANGGGGSIDVGTYRYRIAFVDPSAMAGHDEAPASVTFGSVLIPAAGDSITLNGLPPSSDPTVYTAKRIYRINEDATDATYQLVAEIPASQASYTDTAADASLGAELNDDELDIANYSYFVTFARPGLESRPTSQSATISVATPDRRIRLDNLPQPMPGSEFNTIRIYRNVEGQPNNFYLVDELPAGQTAYVDNTPDSAIENPDNLLNRNGPPINTALPLLNVSTFDGTSYVDLFQEGVLQFTGSKGIEGGLDLATKELTINSETTVLDLLNFMEEALGVQTVSPDPDNPLSGNPGGFLSGTSQLQFESNSGIHNELNISQNAFRLKLPDGSAPAIPMFFSSSQDATGTGSSSEMIVYDSLGIPLTVRLTTSLESTDGGVTTYRWYATSPDNQAAAGVETTVGTGLITFDGNGKFVSTTDSSVSIDRRSVASNSPVTLDLDFTQVTALSESSPRNVQMSSQDGFAAGTLSSFSITESGRIKGVYSNGVTRDLGQILMARFSNPGGLQQMGDNLWAEGVNSGEPLRDIPGSSGNGALTSGAVELSNTDIGQNLIDLILASTQYRGGTRVITSAQQLLDELLSLRR
jgi:flagellar hook protein FlgE